MTLVHPPLSTAPASQGCCQPILVVWSCKWIYWACGRAISSSVSQTSLLLQSLCPCWQLWLQAFWKLCLLPWQLQQAPAQTAHHPTTAPSERGSLPPLPLQDFWRAAALLRCLPSWPCAAAARLRAVTLPQWRSFAWHCCCRCHCQCHCSHHRPFLWLLSCCCCLRRRRRCLSGPLATTAHRYLLHHCYHHSQLVSPA